MSEEEGKKRAQRSKVSDIISNIINTLESGPKSISDISDECSISWESARNYLDTLEEIEFVEYKEEGNKKIYRVKSCRTWRNDTLFGLDVNPEKENVIKYIFSMIRQTWKEKTGRYPLKTEVEKTIYKVNNKLNLGLPVIWYMFGPMCVLAYKPENDYTYKDFKGMQIISDNVSEAVDDLSRVRGTFQIMDYIYRESGNELYVIKHKIKKLSYSEFDRATIGRFSGMLIGMLKYVPEGKMMRNTLDLFSDYVAMITEILNTMTDKEISDSMIKEPIMNAFDELWGLICINNAFNQLSRYGYSTEELMEKMTNKMSMQERLALESISILNEMMPTKRDKWDDEYDEFLKKIGTVQSRDVSEEERKRMAEKVSTKEESEELFRKLDID